MRKHVLSAASLLVLAATAWPVQASAQSYADAGAWSPWLGCWQSDDASASAAICIVPENTGVRMISVVNGAVAEESRVIADGRERDVVQGDCRGTQRATWSGDRRRIYLNSQLACGPVHRNSSGLLAFVDNTHWLSVQSVNTDGDIATRTVRYAMTQSVPMPDAVALALRTAVRTPASADPVTESAVSEASREVDAAAVQEWLHAVGAPYQLAGAEDGAASTTSALEMLAGSAAPVRIVERPVYVRTYIDLHYRHWTPWGYDWFGWHVYRPLVVIHTSPRINYWPVRTVRHYTSHYIPRYQPPRYQPPRDRQPRYEPPRTRSRDDSRGNSRDNSRDRSRGGSRDDSGSRSTGRTAHRR